MEENLQPKGRGMTWKGTQKCLGLGVDDMTIIDVNEWNTCQKHSLFYRKIVYCDSKNIVTYAVNTQKWHPKLFYEPALLYLLFQLTFSLTDTQKQLIKVDLNG